MMASVTQGSFLLAVLALIALSSLASASNFPLAKLDGEHKSQSVTSADSSVMLAQFSDFIQSNFESDRTSKRRTVFEVRDVASESNVWACGCSTCTCNSGFQCPVSIPAGGRYVLTATSAPYGVTVYSLDFMSTDGSGLNVYAMDTANYNLYSAGGTFQYYVAFSHTSVTCLNAPSGKTSGNGFVVVVECTNSLNNCPVRFTLSTSANSAPAPPPVTTPRGGSGGSSGCQCECCMGNYCSPTIVGFASTTCGSCNPAACASAFPASCPAGTASGSTVALCKSSAVAHFAFGAAFVFSMIVFLFFA